MRIEDYIPQYCIYKWQSKEKIPCSFEDFALVFSKDVRIFSCTLSLCWYSLGYAESHFGTFNVDPFNKSDRISVWLKSGWSTNTFTRHCFLQDLKSIKKFALALPYSKSMKRVIGDLEYYCQQLNG